MTLRAICLGLVMCGVMVGMTQVISIRHSAAEVGGNAPPPAPTYLLFFYVLLAAPLLARRAGRLALSRGELLLVYAMMLVAGPITHQYGIGFLVPHCAAPAYLGGPESGWEGFAPALPGWLGPADRGAVLDFFLGNGGAVPWSAWAVPMLAWSSLLIALFWVMLCLNVLVSRYWIEHERLAFPLAALPLALTDGIGRTGVGGTLNSVFPTLLRQPLFWLGLALPLLLQAPGAIHRYVPSVPALPLRDLPIIDAQTALPRPWNGVGQLSVHLIFWLIGVVYLLPQELALSCWLFYFVTLGENVVAVQYGTTGEAPSVYSNDFPALFAQGAGAALALTAITLYTARHHLRRVVRQAFRRPREGEEQGEFLSYRVAVWGALGGIAYMLGWCWLAGMRLWVAAILLGLMLAYFLIFARIRAETGLGMGVILWPKMLDEMMATLVGVQNMTLRDATMVHALRWLYFGPAIGSVMASQLEGFKLADASGVRSRRVGWALALAGAVTVPLAFAWALKTYYTNGFEMMRIGQRGVSMVGSQIYWSYQNLASALDAPTGPQAGGIAALGSGAGVTAALSWLRVRFLWFPLHPVGYLAANSWGMHINWATFTLGWLIKVAVTRYGGLPLYRRLLPLFLGLIVGDMLHQGLWGLVAWVTGGTA